MLANQAPLSTILRRVALTTRVRFVGLEKLHGEISVDLTNVDLKSALDVLLKNYEFVVLGDLSMENGPTPTIWLRSGSVSSSPQARVRVQPNLSRHSEPLPASSPENGPAPDAETLPADDEQPLSIDDQATADPGQKFTDLEVAVKTADEKALAAAILDNDSFVQSTAFEALHLIDRDAATEALLQAVQSDDSATRLQAIQLLQQPGVEDRKLLEVLDHALKDPDQQVQIAAIQGLARRGGSEEVSSLRQLFHEAEDPTLRLMVLNVIGAKERGMLFQALNDPDQSVQVAAALLLEEADQK